MSKKFSVFLTALFCAFIGGVCVISLLLPDKDFLPLENRYPQKPPRLSVESLGSGKFMTFREVPTYGELYIQPFTGRCLKRLTYGFGYKLKAFAEAMERIPGAEKLSVGDVSYEFELINGYRMQFLFWEGDDEFPPSAQILYSDNFQFGFHAEDMVVAGDLSITTVKNLCA